MWGKKPVIRLSSGLDNAATGRRPASTIEGVYTNYGEETNRRQKTIVTFADIGGKPSKLPPKSDMLWQRGGGGGGGGGEGGWGWGGGGGGVFCGVGGGGVEPTGLTNAKKR